MILLGFIAGVLGGLFGIGGGLVIVPGLVLVACLDQKTATGTSLFALVWPVGALAVWEYAGRGEMSWAWGATVAMGLLVGVRQGARLTAPLSPATMKRLYGAFLLIVGAYFVLRSQILTGPVLSGTVAVVEREPWPPYAGLGVGFVAGILGGLFGIGGGLVIVPMLSLLAGFDQKTAVGTSLFAQVWPVGILGVLEYRRRGEARPLAGACIAAGLLVGNLIGAMLTEPMDERLMRASYGAFVILVGLYYQFTIKPRAVSAPSAD